MSLISGPDSHHRTVQIRTTRRLRPGPETVAPEITALGNNSDKDFRLRTLRGMRYVGLAYHQSIQR